MYTITAVVRRDVARKFHIETMVAREQVRKLEEVLERRFFTLDPVNVRRALRLAGWIVEPDSHPGYGWHCGESQREEVIEWCSRHAQTVHMRHRDTHWPWWYMAHPESRTQSAMRVRKILADAEVIKNANRVMEMIPGPRPQTPDVELGAAL